MVLIVGAGPAGATAARTLARAGVTVRLLDRSKFPRNKPCGGGLSARALVRFPHLAPELDRIATHRVSRLRLEGPQGAVATIESQAPAALMIRRVEFDHLLVTLAVEAGAELIPDADIVQAAETGSRVQLVARNGRRYEAEHVIAADGVHSAVARRLGIRDAWPAHAVALDMMEETPRSQLRDVDPSTLWVSYGHQPSRPPAGAGANEGYAYIFPKREHVNIGLGYVLDYYRRSIPESPYELQQGLVNTLRARGIVAGESVRRNFTPFLIPVGGPMRRPGRGRVVLAGDAGGFVNGFTAEGIYYAMVTGELAAKAVCETLRGRARSAVGRYARACAREIGAELRDAVFLQRYLFSDRRRIDAFIDGANRAPAVAQAVVDFFMGRSGYGRLKRRLLWHTPGLAVQLAWQRIRGTAAWPDTAPAGGI